jgi:phospholipase/carboxylesterase
MSEPVAAPDGADRHTGQPALEWGRRDAPVVVVAVHGRDQDPAFMRELARRLGPLPARFVAPVADARSWYPRPFMAPLAANRPRLDHALAAIRGRLAALVGSGVGADRLVLLGFCQGACLLTHLLLTEAPEVAGAVLLTGGHVGAEPLPAPSPTALQGLPVVLRSIEHDPFVPADRVRESARLLAAAGADVDLRIAPGDEHVVTDEACAAAAALVGELAGAGAGRPMRRS